MATNKIIGRNLKAVRERMGRTQSEFADVLGVCESTYGYYESGAQEMPYDLIEKIADFCGCESYLLFEESAEAKNEMLATLFRFNNLSVEDYEEIVRFRDIVKTSLKLERLAAC